jgi:replicative DNA helicase
MLAPDAFDRVGDKLTEDDFYRRDHRLIYRAIGDLSRRGQPFDAVTVGEWFEANGLSEMIAGGAYLIDLASNTPSAANIAAYAKIVRDKSILRQAIDIGSQLVETAFKPNGSDSASILDDAIRALMALHKAEESHEHTLKAAVSAAFAKAQEASEAGGKLMGIPTGIPKVDARLGGWNDSDLILIGARPAMGKTALMVNFADAAAAAGHTVGVVSGEMSALQYGQRAISMSSNVPAELMRNGQFKEEDWPKLQAAARLLNSRQMRLYDRSAPTIEEVQRVARRWRQELGIGILYIDYLQRIRVRGMSNRAEEVGEAARCLKDLARDLNIPVVCLAQVVRAVEVREDKRPGAGDLANSDEATREADQILMLYRDEVYNDNTSERGLAELNCEKNRHGPTGQFILRFDGPTMTFSDMRETF